MTPTAEPKPETLGETLERLITEHKLRKWWVAAELGLERGLLTRILAGQRELRASEVVKLAAIFQVPVATFLPKAARDE